MSSHHIVRDAQEPALIIAGDFSLPYVEPLLEWSPVVVVLEPCLEEVLEWQIKIDVVVSSLERTPNLVKQLEHQFPVEIIFDQPDSLTAALMYLYANAHQAANIVGLPPKIVANDMQEKMTLIFYQNDYKYILPLQSGFKKWVAKDTLFLLAPPTKMPLKMHNLQAKDRHWRAIETGFVEILDLPLGSWLGEKIWE